MLFYNIMVAIDHIKSFFVIEKGKFMKYITVNFLDLFHVSVFPKFVPIAQFNISIPLLIIMSQCRKIEILVFQKIIIVGAIPAVAVTEKNIAVAAVKGQGRSIFKRFIQTMVTAHDYLLLVLWRPAHERCLNRLSLIMQWKAKGR